MLIEGHVTFDRSGSRFVERCGRYTGAQTRGLHPGQRVLTGEPYLMSAEAATASMLIRIPAAPMRAVVTAQTDTAMAMIRPLSGELDAMTGQVVELKARIAGQRLATYLLNMVSEPTATKADFRLPVNKGLLGLLARLPSREPVACLRGFARIWR